jgi:integrase
MSYYKRNKVYWMDATVNGRRYREPLGTSDRREAPRLERERIAQLQNRAPDPTKRAKSYGSMTVSDSIEAYIVERSAQVSPRMRAYWKEQARPLSKFFKDLKLKAISPVHLSEYQNARLAEGRAPKTINGELSVMRQVLKHSRLWYRFREDYKPIPNSKPPVGRALTVEEQMQLFEVAQSRADWMYAHAAATLGIYCGLRACEIKALRWKDIDFIVGTLDIRRSKTPAGWRTPTLNGVCSEVLQKLKSKAETIAATDPEHYVFPWHGREQKIDPTRPITSWRSAWRSILRAAGLKGVRFHDLRHSAVTTLAEAGVADWIIQAQVGHVSPAMMKTYSHVRRLALNQAAAALQPNLGASQHQPELELLN